MKIKEVFVHNFRSIADARFVLRDYSLLVGMNNCGKSNAIDALRVFYEKEIRFDEVRDFPKFKTADGESYIEVEYQLSSDEAGALKAEYLLGDSSFKVRKCFHPQDKAKLGLLAYEGGKLSTNTFYGWKNVGQAKLGRVIYIPAVSRLEDHTKLTGPSVLRDLINDILRSLMKTSAAYADLDKHFKIFEDAIKEEETPDKRSLRGLEQQINNEIEQWGAKFNIDIISPQHEEIIKSLITHTIVDRELAKPLESPSFGHGFQRHLIFSLIRVAASYIPSDSPKSRKEFSPDLDLLLFEEPEAFLHPPQQSILDANLRSLARSPNRQTIAATHSPVFVSCNTSNIADLICMSKTNGQTEASQIDETSLKNLFEDNGQLADFLQAKGVSKENPVDAELESELEAVRHFLWLNPERCGLFFAQYVLIVEGLSEHAVVNHLLKGGAIEADGKSIFVLDACGKFNIHRFMNLLHVLKIRHAVLHDLNKDALQAAVNEYIQRSANSFTTMIATLPKSLEDTLGVAINDSKDRWKASKILLAITKGNVEKEKLEALCAKVKALIDSL